jgi:YD repeat-containing protein
MESHFVQALAPRRTHWPILDELAHILLDECIESRADVLQATGWNTTPVQILPDRGQENIFKFAKVITCATDRAVIKADGRITAISMGGVDGMAFGYDAANRITGINESSQPNKVYTYDALDRITASLGLSAMMFLVTWVVRPVQEHSSVL